MKFDTKKILAGVGIIIFAALLMFLTTCRDTADRPAAEQNEQATEAVGIDLEDIEWVGIAIEWVDPGIDYDSLRFEDAGEGLYLLEAVLANGSSKFGFMDGTGDIMIPMIYDHANIFTDGLAYVGLGVRKLFINPSGAEVLDISEYDSGSPFESGFAMVTRIYTEEIDSGVRLSHLRGLIDASGNEALPCEFEEAGAYENGILWAQQDGKYAMFDSVGNRMTPHEFDYMSYAGEDLIIAQKDEKYGYLDRNGNVAIPFGFDMVGSFFDRRAFVVDNWLSGYINAQGEKITPIEFESAEDFSEGRAAVSMDGMFGFIDTQGDVVIPFIYDEVWPFNGGVAVVIEYVGRATTRVTSIDKYGEAAIIPNDMGYFKWNDTYIAYNDPAFGFGSVNFHMLALLDDEGNRLTGFDFSDIFDFYKGIAVVEEIDDLTFFYGLINQYGAKIIPAAHERVEIVDINTVIIQSFEMDSDTGVGRSRVGIATLPPDAATRQPEEDEAL